jgi:NAD(P)-dependent dehydrogenase (short-subunit alcohol dehydrogenase family)
MMLEGRVAVITGGASGIGRATALRFAEEGARVAILDRDTALAEATVAELVDVGAREPFFTGVDVSSGESVDEAFQEVADQAGAADILMTCAGIRGISDPLELDRDQWDREIGVNLSGTFYCAQAAGRQMAASGRGGSIITVSSTAGFLAYENRSAYSATKSGVIGITKSLARDLGGRGIRVNCIAPGLMRTPFTEAFFADEDLVAAIPRVVPLGDPGGPAVIADGAVFLASDLARYVTGIVLPIDGGHSIMAFNIHANPDSPYSAPRPLKD